MTSADDGTYQSGARPERARLGWSVCLGIMVFSVAALCRGQSAPAMALPKIVMASLHRNPQVDDSLYMAIRAQLSGAPVFLDRVSLPEQEAAVLSAPQVSELARQQRAAMVFWIDVGDICRMYFYMPDRSGGRISSRVIDLDLDSEYSRLDVVAVVASSVIEGLLVSRSLEPLPPEPAETVPRPAGADRAGRGRRWVEVSAAYTGSLLAAHTVTHGGTLGVGVFPGERLILGVTFTQRWPYRFVNETLRLRVVSRGGEVFAAVRLLIRPIDIRLGLSWSVDLRSLSTTSRSVALEALPDGSSWTLSLMPFLCMGWTHRERIGLFGRVGASLSVYETNYDIKLKEDGVASAFEPFAAKLFYQLGLTVWM